MRRDVNAIVYNSDLIFRNASELATLCVFYDKVFLPYTSAETSDLFAGPRFFNVRLPTGLHEKGEQQFIHDVGYWARIYYPLFTEGVLERLSLPPWGDKAPTDLLLNLKLSDKIDLLTKGETIRHVSISNQPFGEGETVENLGDPERWVIKEYLIKQDLALHFLRQDFDMPQVFVSNGPRPSRDFLVGVEARVTFEYLLPALGYLKVDEILEVRRKVKDLREGFSMHLQKLSKGIDEGLKGGESYSEIEPWARSIIETELIPDYREFRRQLLAERSGFWNKVLDAAAKSFQVEATSWTLKFCAELLKAFGLTALTFLAERKEKLSNKSRAFQFMRLVENSDLLRGDEG